jgi:hypothetical protein
MFKKALAISSAVALVAVGAAVAAAPKHGGIYRGVLYKGTIDPATNAYQANPSGWEKAITLHVAASGKSAQILWWCGHDKTINTRQDGTFPIKADGSFAYRKGTGTFTVWAIKGRFTTATAARVALTIPSMCDARGGTATLKLGG